MTHTHKKLVRCLMAAGIVGAASTVHAQQPSQAAAKVEKVEVTGTRIQAPELEGASPVAVIRAEDIKLEGVRNVESLLNNLPQVLAEYGSNDSNGATGIATANLRNLGSVRTLVLVNGRRLPPGSPIGSTLAPTWSADLNTIPAALIRRVDVLTGGASAVYGSDAIAGVINFIMNDNFEGVQGEVNYSFYNHQQNNPKGISDIVAGRAVTNPQQFRVPGDIKSDGETTDVSLMLGGNFADNKGNATVFFGYTKVEALLQSERDFSACALNLNTAGDGYVCGGSGTSYPGQFVLNGGTGAARTVANAAGNTRPYIGATDQYNFGPLNFFQRPTERYSFDAFAHYDVTPHARVYSEFGFHDNHTNSQIAPSGLFGVAVNVTGANPLLSADWRRDLGLTTDASTHNVVILRRNVEGGGRQADLRNTSYRGVLGVKGDVFNNWQYDVYGQMAQVVYQQVFRNELSIARSQRALDVVTNPATGQAACRSFLDGTDLACVPYNIWSLDQVTQGALNYVQIPGFQTGHTKQSVVGATMSADLADYGIKLPGARSGIGVAFGFERRVDELLREVDVAFSSGDLAGQGGSTQGVGGQIAVKDIFMEARLPILERQDWAHLLSVNGSWRRSDYSTGEKTDSYGMGIEWAPVKAVRFRGSYQQAVRAPNVFDLYTPLTPGLYNNTSDPCATATPTATAAQCAFTGVTAAQYGHILDSPAGQYGGAFGGNVNLKAETAKTQTLGIVFEPLPNLSASIDYYNIKVEDVITALPPPTILNQCLATGNPQFCSLITRDSAGTLWLLPQAVIVASNLNVAEWTTSGFDFMATYTHKFGGEWGALNVNFNGTYLKEFKQQQFPGSPEYDCAGLFGTVCGVTLTVLPEWRHKMRATWATPWNTDVALTWRYISEVDYEGTSSSPILAATVPSIDSKLKAMNYIDLAANWRINKNYQLTAGINNLFDEDPPIVNQTFAGAPFGNGNTYPNLYDAIGRKIFVTFTAKF
ncbi:TonB-dependent receptor domain-containing protein [Usitatibacter palustris]|uniref:TonB-dependent receptor domain-containing protein n=1 Tax=Usitatibacter palustris TaxID=2732487 RepID=UPI001BB1381B|nr:TonB-dependent receptor [Usitatibacter palustris]